MHWPSSRPTATPRGHWHWVVFPSAPMSHRKPRRMVLVGPSTLRQPMATVPADMVVIHGETDDVVPLAATLAWARPQSLPVIVFPGVGHFFHGQLGLLKNTVVQELQPRVPL